jgi:spore maturation protein CgeB
MKLFVFGSSLTSTYWNGAATYYRGIYKNLHRLGHHITFAEPDIYGRQNRQDCPHISYADIVVYRPHQDVPKLLRAASTADVIIKHSGVGADDELLEHGVLGCQSAHTRIMFWDVDAPATLARVAERSDDPFRALIPQYDVILTYGGGPGVLEQYRTLGARCCHAIYNALDPDTHHPVKAAADLLCDLVFVGHRLPDREQRVEDYFLRAAILAPDLHFLLGGEGWKDKKLPPNVRWIGHVSSDEHNQVNCSARMVLNINRESMARTGFSPPTRIFEAAGAGACVVTDLWAGVDEFFNPGIEILTAGSASEIVRHLRQTSPAGACEIGSAMRKRALRDHSYASRAIKVDGILRGLDSRKLTPACLAGDLSGNLKTEENLS